MRLRKWYCHQIQSQMKYVDEHANLSYQASPVMPSLLKCLSLPPDPIPFSRSPLPLNSSSPLLISPSNSANSIANSTIPFTISPASSVSLTFSCPTSLPTFLQLIPLPQHYHGKRQQLLLRKFAASINESHHCHLRDIICVPSHWR